jgi:deoxycytidylate deaminase
MVVWLRVSGWLNFVNSAVPDMDDALCTFLRIAKIESQKSLAPYKLGCVIAKKRRILGRGYNVYKTHPKLGVGYHGFFHAETKAIQDALSRGHDLEGATAYIYREGGLLAKPCVHCQKILKSFGITEFVYTQGITYESNGNSEEVEQRRITVRS